jgi:phosphate transport system substrate-binding protein
MNYLTISFFRLALAATLLVSAGTAAAQTTLKVGGSGSGNGIMRLLGAEYAKKKPGVTVIVTPALGTGGGIKAVGEGVLDIGIVGRTPRQNESQVRFATTEFGQSPFVVITHASAPVSTLSFADIANFYGNENAVWSDGKRVRPVLRTPDDVETRTLKSFSPDIEKAVEAARARPGMLVAGTDVEAADAIQKFAGSVGTATLGLVLSEKRSLKVLPVNGKTPSVAALLDSTYPYSRPFFLVMREPVNPAVQEFVAFIQSPAGAAILREHGFLPARTK